MTKHGARVKLGAVQAAWDQVTILRSADNQGACERTLLAGLDSALD